MLINGIAPVNRVISSSGFPGSATLFLADPGVEGTVKETITPFKDLNNNAILDAGDITGDPVVITYKATPCSGANCPDSEVFLPGLQFNFNGTVVNVDNNGVPDETESASVTVCDGGEFSQSEFSHSNPFSNSYNLKVIENGGAVLFNGSVAASAVITADELSASEGITTLTLADPAVGGSVTRIITTFEDLNYNGMLDVGDCAIDPIVLHYTVTPCAIKNTLMESRKSSMSFDDRSKAAIIKLAPNPAKNILNIYTTGFQKDKQTILSIISAIGVTMKTIKLSASTQTLPLDVSSLVSGVYSIKIINGEKVIYKKFVKL